MSEILNSLYERVQSADRPSRRIDEDLYCELGLAEVSDDGSIIAYRAPMYTARLEDAVALVSKMLPSWWWTCGLCALTGHASIGPDYNGPDRERLIKEWPPEVYDHGQFNADLPPGDGIHRVCYALLDCMLQALIAKAAGIPVREG